MQDTVILGIETSCDETAAALFRGPEMIHHITATQLVHTSYGGVVPEYASREHNKLLGPVVRGVLEQAEMTLSNVEGIAVTQGPGLAGSLLVGLSYAKGLALGLDIPLYGINHIEGHIFANFIGQKTLPTPFLCLLVSGGHTQLIHVENARDYKLIGQTRDDAAGEAFDKVARLLGIGYPGGPLIDKMSKQGNSSFHHFPRSSFKGSYDFSFSGLKTNVLQYISKQESEFIKLHLSDIAASFQEAVVDVLSKQTMQAAKDLGHDRIVLAGGVAANSRLRERMVELAGEQNKDLYQPDMRYCTDNAAMIAYMGYWKAGTQGSDPLDIPAVPNLKLSFGG
ncbi:MAG: tRNA (adenosine(37)-N6)-threonylcarbamoyltransferase complex transferase subunit TsaD [Candidatus Marinimicrobia bacterium]|jgi:N6-L-threonylcarbamoyladenine synthase|nr:tRNA (adenosine(37)-N6)-threonylcarbamoyltransferase complex transferase subunit TsaD [Candidatus Neomarinimicrobiota bacterium]MBT3574538.1 tRNA (adenosine(37)-N6)-threonylcarbamoyltransferase complex transferase subunit TsaD [Candidatus Neomarinimicrobiota bacterium]MBT3678711.1 tRNA (adenosine(37)-N6)-threonylcarbamoyltransferase complex transferase subunit TsaD [Candidatus Neomarinimicrobiota bacterium]MBT3952196.1 tRNA (adenosine(37)-N6)-threonylcarbamoyltransferase complex transferase s